MNLMGLRAKLVVLSANSRRQGNRLVSTMVTYLQTSPLFADRFEKVISKIDRPARSPSEPGTDTDLVGIEQDGGICAVQFKFIRANHKVSKHDINSFLVAFSNEPFASQMMQPYPSPSPSPSPSPFDARTDSLEELGRPARAARRQLR